jgi:hypothetical protein
VAVEHIDAVAVYGIVQEAADILARGAGQSDRQLYIFLGGYVNF